VRLGREAEHQAALLRLRCDRYNMCTVFFQFCKGSALKVQALSSFDASTRQRVLFPVTRWLACIPASRILVGSGRSHTTVRDAAQPPHQLQAGKL
jgi:hypothetical protein